MRYRKHKKEVKERRNSHSNLYWFGYSQPYIQFPVTSIWEWQSQFTIFRVFQLQPQWPSETCKRKILKIDKHLSWALSRYDNTTLESRKGRNTSFVHKKWWKLILKKMKHYHLESRSIKIESSTMSSFHKWILVTNLNNKGKNSINIFVLSQ